VVLFYALANRSTVRMFAHSNLSKDMFIH